MTDINYTLKRARRGAITWIGVSLLVAGLMLVPASARAQADEQPAGSAETSDRAGGATPEGSDAAPRGWATRLWGTPQPAAFYTGMWTQHLTHAGIDDNKLVGLGYHGFFGSTFLNSYQSRTYAVGFERTLKTGRLSDDALYSFGYRLGAFHGYNRRLLKLADKTPLLPFVQVVASASWKRVGVQASYCAIVVTGGLFVRL